MDFSVAAVRVASRTQRLSEPEVKPIRQSVLIWKGLMTSRVDAQNLCAAGRRSAPIGPTVRNVQPSALKQNSGWSFGLGVNSRDQMPGITSARKHVVLSASTWVELDRKGSRGTGSSRLASVRQDWSQKVKIRETQTSVGSTADRSSVRQLCGVQFGSELCHMKPLNLTPLTEERNMLVVFCCAAC